MSRNTYPDDDDNVTKDKGVSRRSFVRSAGAIALAASPAGGLLATLSSTAALAQSPATLVVAVDQDASSLKPDTWGPDLNWLAVRSCYDTLCDYAIVEEDGVMTYDPNNLVMRLAESMAMSEDRKTVTWTIRDGMVFGSGNPISAEAVAKSFKWYLERNEVGGSQAKVDGLAGPDSVTFDGNTVTMQLIDTVPWGASANYITLLAVVDVDEI